MGEFPSKENQFKQGQSGNPNGRPPKVLTQLRKELKQQGYERVSLSEIRENIEYLLNMDMKRMEEILNDGSERSHLRLMIRGLLSKKQGFENYLKLLSVLGGADKKEGSNKIEVTIKRKKK